MIPVYQKIFKLFYHCRMANSFLGHGFVQRKQSILRKNDTYINCRGDVELSKYTKRGGQKGGQKSLDAHEHRIPASKMEKIHDFCSGGLNTKGGAKGGHHSRMLVPIIYTMIRCSDACFGGQICIF